LRFIQLRRASGLTRFASEDRWYLRLFDLNNRQENRMKTFFVDETGLELSEYAVAAALVAIAVAVAYSALGDAIGVRLNELVNRVNG
jgi:Flp pilus assembly pilin Flp